MKTSKSRHDTAVQGTNDSSIVSKCSMARHGYFHDDFLHKFVSKQSRRAPLIHRGYYIRAKTIDFILKQFFNKNEGKVKQIISLGAGFDSNFFRLKSEGALGDTVYFEVDFPDVVKRKSCIIQRTDELKSLLNIDSNQHSDAMAELNTEDYKLLGVDLTKLPLLEAVIRRCGAKGDNPTLILSECVLTYMPHTCATDTVRWANKMFSNSIFVLYEQINPDDAFGSVMMNHFHKIGSPLRCINEFPTLQSQLDRFHACGWGDCEALDMNQFYRHLVSHKERSCIRKLEPFDEYEEWHLKCAHYMVLCAYAGSCEKLLEVCDKSAGSDSPSKYSSQGDSDSLLSQDPITVTRETTLSDRGDNCTKIDLVVKKIHVCDENMGNSVLIRRFGHASTRVDNVVFTVGGFGHQGERHCRLMDSIILDTNTGEITVIPATRFIGDATNCVLDRLHHSAVPLSDKSILIIGGRQSPLKPCDMTRLVNLKLKNRTTTENTNAENEEITDICSDTVAGKYHKNEKSVSDQGKDNSGVKCLYKTDQSGEIDVLHICRVNANLSLDVICSGCYGDVPSNRWRHSAVVYRNSEAELVYVYGGTDMTYSTLADCYMLDIHTSKWSQVFCGGEVPRPRHSHAAHLWQDYMVIAGGLDEELSPLNTVHLLHLGMHRWEQLKLQTFLKPRYSHTAHIVDDVLILVGGVNLDHTPPGLALISLHTGHCEEYALPQTVEGTALMYHNHTSALMENSSLWVLGGGGTCFSFGTHLNMSPFILDIRPCLQHFSHVCHRSSPEGANIAQS